MKNWVKNISPYIKEWRGKGFLYALVLKKEISADEFVKNEISIITNKNNLIICPVLSLTQLELKRDLNKLSQFLGFPKNVL